MRTKTTTAVLLVLLLGALTYLPGARAQDRDPVDTSIAEIEAILESALLQESGSAESASSLFGLLFGHRIAGTYYTASPPFGGTLTLFADGNVAAISGTCCGNAPNIQSEAFGNWERTGTREIELTTVVLATQWQIDQEDENGHFHTGPADAFPGVWGRNWIATPTMTLEFAPDFKSFEGSLTTAIWFADPVTQELPNILADDAPPPDLCVGPFPVADTRLPVEVVECE